MKDRAIPKSRIGMTRHVIELTKQQNENDFMVELVIGKRSKQIVTANGLSDLDRKTLEG